MNGDPEQGALPAENPEDDEPLCGYSYDHDVRDDDTECRECGAEIEL